MKVCPVPDCPTLVHTGRCPEHQRQYEQRRGSSARRGYDAAHRRERARWAPLVARGQVDCWRCGKRIQPGEAWDLGHDDHDRSITRGPEHANRCNRAAAGRAAHK